MYRNSKVLIFILSQLQFSLFIFIYLCNMFCDSLLVAFSVFLVVNVL